MNILNIFHKNKVPKKQSVTDEAVDDPTVGMAPEKLSKEERKNWQTSRSPLENKNLCHWCKHPKEQHMNGEGLCSKCSQQAKTDTTVMVCGKFN